jgi:hypothetical protein
MKRSTIAASLLLASLGLVASCTPRIESVTIEERTLASPNPTSYEFKATITQVKGALRKCFSTDWRIAQGKENREKVWDGPGDAETKRLLTLDLREPPGFLHWKGDQDIDYLTDYTFDKPGNEDDAYYVSYGAPLGESDVYLVDGHPLIYSADFHIHIAAVGQGKTRLQIFTHHSRVTAGIDESWSPHGPANVYVQVPPTTIEEYQLLLRVGRELGANEMPPLVTPGPNAPVKEVTLPRER